jgi:hypothetical protein
MKVGQAQVGVRSIAGAKSVMLHGSWDPPLTQYRRAVAHLYRQAGGLKGVGERGEGPAPGRDDTWYTDLAPYQPGGPILWHALPSPCLRDPIDLSDCLP